MAKRLVNELSWSFSRHQTFAECQKKYWYTYYGSWEGWPKTPYDARTVIDPLASHLYALKQIQQLPMFVGTCVHEAIETVLKRKQLPTLEELVATAHRQFQKGIDDTRAEKWRLAPKKHANLFEYYFRESKESDPLTKELELDGLKKISECLKNWYDSPIVKMAFDARTSVVSVEELSHFFLDPYKILVVIDFAMKWKGKEGAESLILFDWKTGQESDKTEDQLYSYALYAHRVLGMPYDRIILSPFYLMSNKYTKIGYGQERPIEQERIKQVEQFIHKSCEQMAEKLPTRMPSADDPQPDPRLFPYTERRTSCTRCPFKNVCSSANYEELSREELVVQVVW